MAVVQGKGSTKQRDVVLTTYPNAVTQDGKRIYCDIELDVRDERTGAQTNPHLFTKTTEKDGGAKDYKHAFPYTVEQFNKMREVADHQTVTNPETGQSREVYTFKADIMPPFHAKSEKDAQGNAVKTPVEKTATYNDVETKTVDTDGKRESTRTMPDGGVERSVSTGFIVNPKTVAPPAFTVDKDIVTRQFEATREAIGAKRAAQAEKAAQAPAKTAEKPAVSFEGANDRKVEEPAAAAPEAPAATEAPALDPMSAKLAELQATMEANQGSERSNEGPDF